jgi:hypothetical protein
METILVIITFTSFLIVFFLFFAHRNFCFILKTHINSINKKGKPERNVYDKLILWEYNLLAVEDSFITLPKETEKTYMQFKEIKSITTRIKIIRRILILNLGVMLLRGFFLLLFYSSK